MAFNYENHKELSDSLETAELLKDSLKIVDDIAKIDMENFDDYDNAEFDFEVLEKIVKRAKKLTKHRLWKLK